MIKDGIFVYDDEPIYEPIPICYKITLSNGEEDYISRKYIAEYLNNFELWYPPKVKIKKIEVSSSVSKKILKNLDYELCGFTREDVFKELALHRRMLKNIKKMKIKHFAKDIQFDAGMWIDKIIRGGGGDKSNLNKGQNKH